MNHERTPHDRIPDDEREWLVQERAFRDERSGAAASEDPLLTSYREVVCALRTPPLDPLPGDFARTVAARCGRAAARVDTRFEQMVQLALLVVLAMTAALACATYGSDWLRSTVAAMPQLDQATTLNWAAALAACLGLSWATDALRRGIPARSHPPEGRR